MPNFASFFFQLPFLILGTPEIEMQVQPQVSQHLLLYKREKISVLLTLFPIPLEKRVIQTMLMWGE